MESPSEEFDFGLPEEVLAALAELADWDDWKLEEIFSEAAFAIQERLAASTPDTAAAIEQSLLSAFLTSGEQETWGIDEPLTADDFSFLDDDEDSLRF